MTSGAKPPAPASIRTGHDRTARIAPLHSAAGTADRALDGAASDLTVPR